MKEKIIIIPAKGNSLGIKRKNLINFCGKPLLYWSIMQAKKNKIGAKVYVSSESDEIINYSCDMGVYGIKRPQNLAKKNSSSESAIIDVCEQIEAKDCDIIFLQATSPLRFPNDIKNAYDVFKKKKLDSLFSAHQSDGFFDIWEKRKTKYFPITIDYRKRLMRQKFKNKHLQQNGSIYIFKKNILLKYNNRIGGKIGVYPMKNWQTFELDTIDEIKNMELLFNHNLIKYYKN